MKNALLQGNAAEDNDVRGGLVAIVIDALFDKCAF